MADVQAELLELTQRLLDCIARADWQVYEELCDPSLTCFEPEALGQRVHGLAFHRYFFDRGGIRGPHETHMVNPHVRLMNDVAIVTYVRLVQSLEVGAPVTKAFEETRVWRRDEGRWRHVHFHRSKCAA